MTAPDDPRAALREELAALAHEQWCGWMRYLYSKARTQGNGDYLCIPKTWWTRWLRQMDTAYAGLSEAEKDSDRKEADRVLAVLSGSSAATQSTEKKEVEIMREGEDSVASTSSRTAATHESQSEQSSGVELIAAERARQMQQEGWTPAHDDDHGDNELLRGAACYVWAARQAALPLGERMSFWDVTYPDQRGTRAWPVPSWPWEACWWKPTTDSVRNLVKAGALIAAEIDRMQREHKAVVASTETHGDGNQLPSGLRGHPGVPCTPTAGTRDLESSSADSIPLPRHPSERQTPIAPDSEWQSFIRSAWQHIDTCTAGPCEECRAIYARLTVTRVKP